jgi:hypothetical protein
MSKLSEADLKLTLKFWIEAQTKELARAYECEIMASLDGKPERAYCFKQKADAIAYSIDHLRENLYSYARKKNPSPK